MFKHSLTAKRDFLNACLSTTVVFIFSMYVRGVIKQPIYQTDK